MKNKNDKIKITFIVFVVFFLLSWIIEGGVYDSTTGLFTSVGITRMGLFDIISVIYSAFYYKIADIVFLLAVGGCYQVLSNTLMYRKLVDKVSSLIKGKEAIAMIIITTLMALYASITSNIMILFVVAPFIVTIFLRNGYNRLTAFSAGFGGMFLGYLGLTYGTYNMSYLNEAIAIDVNELMIQKWVILLIAVVLFNVFSILYMRKHADNKDQTKYDLYATEELKEEKKIKVKGKEKKVRVWPLVLIGILSLLVLLLGYIDWINSFNVNFFSKLYTNIINSVTIADIPVISSIFGSRLTAFGTWTDLLYATFVLMVGIVIISLIGKVKFNDFIEQFGIGMKKMIRVAFIYGFATSVLFLISMYPWPITFVNYLAGSGTFNIIVVLILAILASVLAGDPNLCAYMFGTGMAVLYGNDLTALSLLWRIGGAIATFVGPTSIILLATLTYLNIPYKNWLKYIWKFLFSFILLVLILVALAVYV